MSFDIAGTGAVDADYVGGIAGLINLNSGPQYYSRKHRKTALAANTTLTAKYKTNSATATNTHFQDRWMAVTPVRVA